MLLKKEGFPEEGELVLCTVTGINPHSVFAVLDEYSRTGLLHISEVSPGRIRNLRDFVVEGKKIVCKVIKVTVEKGHIDLSLRRVTETQRRSKINEIKKEQKAEKIIELVGKKFKLEKESLYRQIFPKSLLEEHSSLYGYFEALALGRIAPEMKLPALPADVSKELLELIKARIKEPEVRIEGRLRLTSYLPNGIDVVKEGLLLMEKEGKGRMGIYYEGGGRYKMSLVSSDYKQAEKVLENALQKATEFMEKNKSMLSFARQEK